MKLDYCAKRQVWVYSYFSPLQVLTWTQEGHWTQESAQAPVSKGFRCAKSWDWLGL